MKGQIELKTRVVKVVGIVLGAGIILTALAACGGGPAGGNNPSAAPSTAPAAPAPAVSSTPPAPPPPPAGPASDILAAGKLVYEETAGGVGCAACHGLDGKGESAPYIQGAQKSAIRSALSGAAPAMNFIKLSEEELTAVYTYLQNIDKQQ